MWPYKEVARAHAWFLILWISYNCHQTCQIRHNSLPVLGLTPVSHAGDAPTVHPTVQHFPKKFFLHTYHRLMKAPGTILGRKALNPSVEPVLYGRQDDKGRRGEGKKTTRSDVKPALHMSRPIITLVYTADGFTLLIAAKHTNEPNRNLERLFYNSASRVLGTRANLVSLIARGINTRLTASGLG